MSWFPALPEWDALHPVVVHFPVALLFAAALLVFAGLFARASWRAWAGAALLMMVAGTVAAWFAAASGHAAGQLVDKAGAVGAAVTRHEALGVLTRNVFTALTLAFALLVALPRALPKPPAEPLRITVFAAFLVVYLGATTLVARTANEGVRLVHATGVRALMASAVEPSAPAEAPSEAPPPAAEGAAGPAGGSAAH
uniref:DUF2231 domain-containing protein n=1 Tax=Eiseniibacteriota bacterium TaxID=2212470 RepID=A0A832I1K7_UNCEI